MTFSLDAILGCASKVNNVALKSTDAFNVSVLWKPGAKRGGRMCAR
jgi:hypothetical protein